MALIVIDKAMVPHPGHWILTHPDGGFQIRHPELVQVYREMRRYCTANGKPVPNMQEMDVWLCAQSPQLCADGQRQVALENGLTESEIKGLIASNDPTLIGNRIAALTSAMGIPPCGSCGSRQDWLNKAHQWLREQLQ